MSSTHTDKNSPILGLRMNISKLELFPNRVPRELSRIAFPIVVLVKGWPYEFRSTRATGSSILDHDFGHLCFGRRIQISRQDDVCHESQLRFDFQSLLVASALTKMNASSWRKGRITILYEVQVGNRFLRGLLHCWSSRLPDLLCRRDWFVSFSSDFGMFVIQSFAFVLRFHKVTALIHWSLNTFLIQRELFRDFPFRLLSCLVAT